MADCPALPLCAHVQLPKSYSRYNIHWPRNGVTKSSYGVSYRRNHANKHLKSSTESLASDFLHAPLVGNQYMKWSSLRCCCLGALIKSEIVMSNNWVPVTDQMLLAVSMIFTYLAGVIPQGRIPSVTGDTIGNQYGNASNSTTNVDVDAIGRGTKSTSNDYWHETREKLFDALSAFKIRGDLEGKLVETDYKTRVPLNMVAVDEGPRLRLICIALQRLQQEVSGIPHMLESANREDWVKFILELIKGATERVCIEWLEEELEMNVGDGNMKLPSNILAKFKGDDRILQNVRRLGKTELYADLLFFLRFGFLSAGCCYDTKDLAEHGVSILEDLLVSLADTIANIFLELISIDSDISTEVSSLGLALCCLSTRSLQKLRNEVALNRWLHENFESVVLMYEDCFELHVLNKYQLESSVEGQTQTAIWWKKFVLGKSKTASTLCYVRISPFSLSVKRTKELRALTGWRYYYSLFLELSDISTPLIKSTITRISNAISFFLVYIIGRSLGLIFNGIRQSLGWR